MQNFKSQSFQQVDAAVELCKRKQQSRGYIICLHILESVQLELQGSEFFPIPRIARILVFWKKMSYTKIVALISQLTQNSPTCGYIGQNPRKWKLCYTGTK